MTGTRSAMPNAKIQVGEAIAAAHGERADGGSGYGAVILLREPEHLLAKRISLLDGEHRYPRFRFVAPGAASGS